MVDALKAAEASETGEALRVYVRAKQAIAELLREAGRALGPRGAEDPRIDALLSRLAEDRFHLVVLGEFKRGKSSLINAILGRELLPTTRP
jgi:ribosome biogenesis GTPase A